MIESNFSQSVSFIDIPAGYRIAIQLLEFGQTGYIEIFGLFDIDGRKVPVFNRYDCSSFTTTNDVAYIDMDSCKLISLGVRCSVNTNAFLAKHVVIYLAKWQGRGAFNPVGILLSQDVSPSNPISFPVPTQKQHPSIFGTPAVIEGVVDFKIIEFTIPNNWLFHINGLTFKMITDATVDNRLPYVDITSNSVIVNYSAFLIAVVASSACTFSLSRASHHIYDSTNLIQISRISDYYLCSGDIVTVRTPNFQLGDEYQDYYLSGEYIHTGIL